MPNWRSSGTRTSTRVTLMVVAAVTSYFALVEVENHLAPDRKSEAVHFSNTSQTPTDLDARFADALRTPDGQYVRGEFARLMTDPKWYELARLVGQTGGGLATQEALLGAVATIGKSAEIRRMALAGSPVRTDDAAQLQAARMDLNSNRFVLLLQEVGTNVAASSALMADRVDELRNAAPVGRGELGETRFSILESLISEAAALGASSEYARFSDAVAPLLKDPKIAPLLSSAPIDERPALVPRITLASLSLADVIYQDDDVAGALSVLGGYVAALSSVKENLVGIIVAGIIALTIVGGLYALGKGLNAVKKRTQQIDEAISG